MSMTFGTICIISIARMGMQAYVEHEKKKNRPFYHAEEEMRDNAIALRAIARENGCNKPAGHGGAVKHSRRGRPVPASVGVK